MVTGMESPTQRLSEVQFRQARNGYETGDVDAYVDRVNAALGQLQNQVRELRHRLHDAEGRAASSGETEDTLRRTLVLAQRTADAAIAEARSESEAILSEASGRVDQMMRDAEFDAERRVREAESQATLLRAEAEREARRVVEATRQPLLEEIRDLEQLRNFLNEDVTLLEESLDANRTRVRAVIEQLSVLVDEPERMRAAATPELSGAALGEPGVAGVEVAPVAEWDLSGAGDDEWSELSETWVDDQDVDDAADVSGELAPEDERAGQSDDLGPPTEAHEVIDLTIDPPGDSFLSELRRAVADPAESDDATMISFFGGDDDEPDRRSRFGRRR